MALARKDLFKLIEFLLALTCIGLEYHSFIPNDITEVMINCGTFIGFSIILLGILSSFVTGAVLDRKLDIFYSLVGCALFITAGALSIQYFQNWTFNKETSRIGLAKGSVAIINGAIFLIDAFFSFKQ